MIKVSGVTFSWGDKPLFDKVSFAVAKGQKVGLVGPNGSGKTTLLNLITRKETPKEGKIETSGSVGIVLQEIGQDPDMEKAKTVRDYIVGESGKPDFELKKMLSGLEIGDVGLDGHPQSFSGGQKTKLALAKALTSEPDILLLDEPTNFMDAPGKIWVSDFLSKYSKTLVLISHDLNLIDRAIDKVLAINPTTGKIEEYKGNFTKAMKLKAEHDELTKRKYLAETKHIKNMEEGLKKLYKYTSKKGVRARVMLERRIERLKENLPELPQEVRKIKVSLPDPANVGELPIRAVNISKSYGENKVLENVNFTIKRGERIALIGPNGSGKSTFLKILIGKITEDSGEVIRNLNLKCGYYSQEFETFDLKKTVLETFVAVCRKDESFARAFLGRYMFLGDKVFQRVETLSGGEKTRLSIACLTGRDYNLLILDEPTTYLDVVSQRVILEALKTYKGAMIIVSHTEEFVRELAPSRVLILPENKFTFWSDEFLDLVNIIST
jgi:ATP-binding cassette, subfamily F, member 3